MAGKVFNYTRLCGWESINITSVFTLAILIAIRWNISIYYSTAIIAIFGTMFVAFIYLSGWINAEREYAADLSDLRSLHKKVDEIKKMLEGMK